MPIREIQCPECGSGVKIGLPRGSTVHSVAITADPASLDAAEESDPTVRTQRMRCGNDHPVSVVFEA